MFPERILGYIPSRLANIDQVVADETMGAGEVIFVEKRPVLEASLGVSALVGI